MPASVPKDDSIDLLVFRNKYEIAISDILILPLCFLKVKPKVNKKIKRNEAHFHCFVLGIHLKANNICFQMDTQYKNLKNPIQNLKYPIKPKRGG